jgi:hypothetical protein
LEKLQEREGTMVVLAEIEVAAFECNENVERRMARELVVKPTEPDANGPRPSLPISLGDGREGRGGLYRKSSLP